MSNLRTSHVPEVSTLVELARYWTSTQPHKRALTFLGADGCEAAIVDYASLDHRARAVAATLQAALAPGARVLLLYSPGLDFITGFYSCLYAGMVAVPAYPPATRRSQLSRLQAIIQDSGATAILTTREVAPLVEAVAHRPDGTELSLLVTDDIADATADAWSYPVIGRDSLAFLQYTSGSTGLPKGVMVSHGNLLSNQQAIEEGFAHDRDTIFVGWTPLYHDMGLIGNVLQPLYLGIHSVLMAPMTFLQRPFLWLEAITRYRATTSGGPNFAYDLCADRITADEKSILDLSSWSVAFNGAEPVRADTLDRFAEAFAICGFQRNSLFPCYGMAETTLFVSGADPRAEPVVTVVDALSLREGRLQPAGTDAAGSLRLASSGRVRGDQEVRIVDPASTAVLTEGKVGEIWIRGSSISAGYWERGDETERTFRARTADRDGPWLRTGDLGAMVSEEIFVTGRLKEVLIVRGRNHYPQDIEFTAEMAHAALRPHCGTAFAIEVEGEERVVLVQEIRRTALRKLDAPAVETAIRAAVAASHELALHDIVLVPPGTILKTSSGKLQRMAMRDLYLGGRLPATTPRPPVDPAPSPARTDLPDAAEIKAAEGEARTGLLAAGLAHIAATAVRTTEQAVKDASSMSLLGFDSLALVEMRRRVEVWLGLGVPLSLLLSDDDCQGVATALSSLMTDRDRTQDRPALIGPVDADDDGVQTDVGPASEYQEALWFRQQHDPADTALHLAVALRIPLALPADKVKVILARIVERHPALRSTFTPAPLGEQAALLQHIRAPGTPCLDVLDSTGLPPEVLEARLASSARRTYDLENGPLFRTELHRLGPSDCLILLTAHHLVADLWSLKLVLDEFANMLADEEGSADPDLGPLAYARRQRRRTAKPRGAKQEAYWKNVLSPPPPPLDLPTEEMTPGFRPATRDSAEFAVGAHTIQRLADLGRRSAATLNMVCLAAFKVLLHRHTGQDDIALVAPVSIRPDPRDASTVNYCVNLVVLRTAVSAGMGFAEVLSYVREAVLGALDNAELPFSRLAATLPAETPGRPEVARVMFVFETLDSHPEIAPFILGTQGGMLPAGPAGTTSHPMPPSAAQADLTLTLVPAGDRLIGRLQVDPRRFADGAAERIATHFLNLLDEAAADAGRPVGALRMLTGREVALLEDAAGTWTPSAPETVHRLFERCADRNPERTALVAGADRLSYRELDASANRVAGTLARRHGIGPGALVGVHMDRTAGMIATMLGILKTGAAYVPVDPAYPPERIAAILDDSDAALVVSDAPGSLPPRVPTVEYRDLDAGEPAGRPASAGTASDRAYVLFTSGSTGRPKGVEIEHGSVAALIEWAGGHYGPEELACVFAGTSICFDLSVFEIFVPLCQGGMVVLGDHPLAVAETAEEVTLINTVPSAAAALLQSSGIPTSVRTINLAGEPLRQTLVDALHERTGVRRVYDLYGPTEDTVYSTCILRDYRGEETIGRPIAGSRAYVLGPDLHLVPPGVPGELHLGGCKLARGYLGRPDLTAAAFLTDTPLRDREPRLYRTGDVVRLLPDGRIRYLGRRDAQVKVRGFRIELAEIEIALDGHPSIREAAVSVQHDAAGDAFLVAHVVPSDGGPPDMQALREHLDRHLPPYMVPAVYRPCAALPRTLNGKIDRKALPKADATGSVERIAPRTRTEARVHHLWAAELGTDAVDVERNFFDAGGHSLALVRLVTDMRREFGIEMPLPTAFRLQTVAAQAAYIDLALQDPPLSDGQVLEEIVL